MVHIFRKGTSDHTLLLLHGTGGDEYDLLGVGKQIDPLASVLSLRGNIKENGMNRFFKRLSMGVFDQEDLAKQTTTLYYFIQDAAKMYQFDLNKTTIIGYSNGANIAANLLLTFEAKIKKGILLHPMVPSRGKPLPNLNEVDVFIGVGKNDPICSVQETIELETLLKKAEARVQVSWFDQGHYLNMQEISAAKEWLNKIWKN